ncbi:MAG: polysaccharide deacetylase family protein [Vicinamibacterales bacterium]
MTVRDRLSYGVRMAVSHALYYAGILHLLVRFGLRRKAVVLMYHRVLTPEQRARTASQPGLIVEDATFARHVALLKRWFTVLTLEAFAARLARREPFDGPCCLITFDDGWIDNLENALPVLRRHGAPAVIFLPVSFIGGTKLFTREALTHQLARLVELCRVDAERTVRVRALLAPLGLDSVLDATDGDALDAARHAVSVHKYASGPAFDDLVAALSAELGADASSLSGLDRFIDWTQARDMAAQGITFGGHGVDHRVLTTVTPDVVRYEVETSKAVLDSRCPAPVDAFAYPNGGWNPSVCQDVRAAGYRMAFTIESGAVSCDDDPFTLRRVSIHDGMTRSNPMFLARLTGLF